VSIKGGVAGRGQWLTSRRRWCHVLIHVQVDGRPLPYFMGPPSGYESKSESESDSQSQKFSGAVCVIDMLTVNAAHFWGGVLERGSGRPKGVGGMGVFRGQPLHLTAVRKWLKPKGRQ